MVMANIFNYFDERRKERIAANFGNIANDDQLFERFTTLQNEIGASFDNKITAITSISGDEIPAHFARAYADAFARNGSSVLLIDANMYNPVLRGILGVEGDSEKPAKINDKVSAVYFDKEIYPSNIFKAGAVHNLIKKYGEEFDHIVILVPSIKKHKEVVLLKDILGSFIILAQRNLTRKGDIFDAIQYCAAEQLPLAKITIIK